MTEPVQKTEVTESAARVCCESVTVFTGERMNEKIETVTGQSIMINPNSVDGSPALRLLTNSSTRQPAGSPGGLVTGHGDAGRDNNTPMSLSLSPCGFLQFFSSASKTSVVFMLVMSGGRRQRRVTVSQLVMRTVDCSGRTTEPHSQHSGSGISGAKRQLVLDSGHLRRSGSLGVRYS
ncbi:hypothetical protein J6590_044340 [Homalodisca vitripennis]|nr:hypothetical protein J6590_044340 [Homalodisca vitripennis]